MLRYYSYLLEQSCDRTKEGTLSIFGINNPELREHLSEQMSQLPGEKYSFLAPPVFEHTFAWKPAEVTVEQLSDKLLDKVLIKALDNNKNGRYRFGKEFKPFEHQLKSWNTLLKDKKSIIVTSGTGSGKTECFMVPILQDLYEQAQINNASLEGVHALFLYPLNALINSQEERLDAWTSNFGDKIRYCLYNGHTTEYKSEVDDLQKLKPNQVLSRQLMREKPAPILLTNGSMLEYIMIRKIDAPIVNISREKKSLRWIVLDEAHNYIGSQAAELALQLRRVLDAFGVESKDVRFIATSATIADTDAEQQLKLFLSQLAGVDEEQIVVIDGERVVPGLQQKSQPNNQSYQELALIDEGKIVSEQRFNALLHNNLAYTLRAIIIGADEIKAKALTTKDIQQKIKIQTGVDLTQLQVLEWIDLLTHTKSNDTDEPFLKVRAHFLQRITVSPRPYPY